MSYARYFIEYMAWFICSDSGVQCHRLYGPFDDKEIELAKQIHKVKEQP